MADFTTWWILGGVLVALEMATGTLYMLMLALGMAAGAVAAHAGLGNSGQLVAAAVVGGGATLAWHLYRRSHPRLRDSHANPDVNLDIGETVHVDAWKPDGTASVRYRGANWTVVAAEGQAHRSGTWRVREVIGSRLVVEKT